MRLVLACAFALLVPQGCRQQAEAFRTPLPAPVVDGVALTPADRLPAEADAGEYMLVVRLQLVAVQVPIGSVSDSEELWSYLDEFPPASKVGASLAVNGVRAGLGRPGDWQDVERILRRLTGRAVQRMSMIAQPGSPVAWVLKPGEDWQTVFIRRPDRTYVGFEYQPGDNVLMLGPNLDVSERSTVRLMGALVIRSAHRQPRYTQESGSFVLSSQPEHYLLPDLEFTFRVPPGGFLLVGPGSGVQRTSSPGYRFLVHERNGLKFETLLVIWPEVFAAPLVKRG